MRTWRRATRARAARLQRKLPYRFRAAPPPTRFPASTGPGPDRALRLPDFSHLQLRTLGRCYSIRTRMSAVQEFASAQASGSSSPGLDGLQARPVLPCSLGPISHKTHVQTIFNPQTLTRKGLCPVTAIKGQHGQGSPAESHSLYFEQHGTGPEKVLFIMGSAPIILRGSTTRLIEKIDLTAPHLRGRHKWITSAARRSIASLSLTIAVWGIVAHPVVLIRKLFIKAALSLAG
jgi:hypothetical protein